jgi:hypothetical protein
MTRQPDLRNASKINDNKYMQFRPFSRLKRGRQLSLSMIAVFACLLGSSFWPGSTPRAHVPITTKMTFNRDVVRILQRNCLSCHRPGGIAFSLATYEEARPWAKDIEYEVLRQKMPPWNAVKGFGDFINAPQLTQRDIDLIVNWTEGGTPKGEDKDLPSGPLYNSGWQLGTPDLTLKTGSERRIAAGEDKYETISVATGLKEESWLSAIDLKPGNSSFVHCAVFYLESSKGGGGDVFLGSWVPGQKPARFPDGVGMLLPAGSSIKVRIHYHGGEAEAADQSEIGVYLTHKRPGRSVTPGGGGDPGALIPTGEATRSCRTEYTVDHDCDLVAIRPAASQSIVSLQVTAYRPDGIQEVIIWTRGATSDWAPVYYLRRPTKLPKGTKIETVAYIQEPDQKQNGQAKELRWSDISRDPLCILFLATRTVEAPAR